MRKLFEKKYRIIIAIFTLVVLNSSLFVFRDKIKLKKISPTLQLPYGSSITKDIKNRLYLNQKQYIAVFLLIHPFIDYTREIIWANLIKQKSKDNIDVKIITYDDYQYINQIISNGIEFVIDYEKNILSQLGNLGKAKLKLIIIKNDSVIYCNHVGLNIIAEAGGILNQHYKFDHNPFATLTGDVTNLQHTITKTFKKLKSNYNYYIFYNSICTKCQGGDLLKTIADSEKYKNDCAIIFSSFNNPENITAFFAKNTLDQLHSFLADSTLYAAFDLAQEPVIYKKDNENIQSVPEGVFLHKIKE